MSESMKFQYTDPNTGFEQLSTARFDIAKFRRDESGVPTENFYLDANYPGGDTMVEMPDLVEACMVANPFNPYACSARPVVYGIVKYKPTANSLVLTKNPQELKFVVGVPIAIIRKFHEVDTPVAYLIPTAVGTQSIDFASSLVSLGVNVNFIAVQMQIPVPYAPNFTNQNTTWGVKALMERPAAPSLDANAVNGVVTVTLTPSPFGSFVTKKYNIYVISQTSEVFDPVYPLIHGNRKPDLILNPGDLNNKPLTTWGGGVDAGGGNITTGTYFVVAIAKDTDTDMKCNVSTLSNIDIVTI